MTIKVKACKSSTNVKNFVPFTDATQTCPHSNESPLTPSRLPTPTLSLADTESPLVPSVSSPCTSSPSPNTTLSTPPTDPAGAALPDSLSPAPSPSSGESEEEKAKKLLYCSLCKVAVNSLSQLEAHNKGNSKAALSEKAYFLKHITTQSVHRLERVKLYKQQSCAICCLRWSLAL